jgi:DNA (cytosine-5)-methyltransferase 1
VREVSDRDGFCAERRGRGQVSDATPSLFPALHRGHFRNALGEEICPAGCPSDRPLLVDLGCGAGGASEGYYRAGFDILGVDIEPQPRYPFHFVQMDALLAMRVLLAGGVVGGKRLASVSAFHASMPCQKWAAITVKGRENHPDLITPLRPLLEASGRPWVMENVLKAPLIDPVMVCGGALGCVSGELQLHRHRSFEANFPLVGTECETVRPQTVSVVGHGCPTGNRATLGRNPTIAEKREAMGITWTNRDELSEAIPPAYSEHVGAQLLAHVNALTRARQRPGGRSMNSNLHGPPMQAPSGRVIQGGASGGEPKSGHGTPLPVPCMSWSD